MSWALERSASADRRTSFGDPVLPDVDRSTASSGCSSCRPGPDPWATAQDPPSERARSSGDQARASGSARPGAASSTTCPAARAAR